MKKYTVEFTEKDIAALLELINFIGRERKSTLMQIIERKLYKAIGL